MAVVFSNNGKTTLSANVSSSATSISVSDGSVFPSLGSGEIFFCTLDDGTNNEIVKVTAISSNTLTVVRAQESTTARAFSTGDAAELRLTAGILGLFSQTGVVITDEIESYLDGGNSTPTFASITSNGQITSSGKLLFSDRGDYIQFGSGGTAISWTAPVIFREDAHLALSDYSGVKLGGYNGTDYGPRVHAKGDGNLSILDGALQIGNTTVIGSDRDFITNDKLTFDYNDHYFQAGTNSISFKNSVGTSYWTSNNSVFTFNTSVDLNSDSAQLQFGADNDMQIFHNGAGGEINNATGDFVIDSVGDINLDAEGNDIKLKDGGTEFGRLSNSSLSLQIFSPQPNADINFVGNDDGSTITALTLDMSVGGQLKAAPLGVSTPTYAFSNDSNTGMTRPTGDTLQFVTNGAERLRISNTSININNSVSYFNVGGGAGGSGTSIDNAGNIQTDGTISSGAITSTGAISAEDNIYLTDAGTVRGKLLLNASDRDNVELRAESLGSTMKFFTVGTQALLLDASQNATFAGKVTINEGDVADQLVIYRTSPSANQVGMKFDVHGVHSRFFGVGTDGHPYWSTTANLTGAGNGVWHSGLSNFKVGTVSVLTSSRNLQNIGTISSGAISSSSNITAGNSSNNGYVQANLASSGGTMTLYGYGLEMNRSASYIRPSSDNTNTLYFGDTDASLDWNAIYFRSTNGLYMTGTQFLTTDRNLVNIGTINTSVAMSSSPTNIIYMAMSGNNDNGGGGAIRFDTSASNTDTTKYYASVEGIRSSSGDGSNELAFFTAANGVNGSAPTRKMTIDEDGRVLVGTTDAGLSSSNSATGINLRPNSASAIARSGGTALYLNRLTDDGDLVAFRKDGTTVGSIGTYASDLHIGTGNTGIGFNDNGRSIVPMNTSTPAYAGSLISLGTSSVKFKDLHLSGTVTATTYTGALASAVTATTQSAGDNSTKVATTAYTDTAIANLADSAPSTLNTLNELAAALGDDANFSTTVTNSIATKLPLAGGTMTGNLTLNGADIVKSGSADLTIDVGGRINLSADDNGEVRLYDGSSLYGQFKDDDDRLSIQGLIQDKDMLFVVNDGGSMTTALKLDAVDGGDATFYGNVDIKGGILNLGTADSSSGHINAYENMSFNIDVDNDDTNRYFSFHKNGSSASSTELMRLTEDGKLGINDNNPDRKVSIIGDSTSEGQYPLSLDATNTDYTIEFKRNGSSEWWIKQAGSAFNIHENGVGDLLRIYAGGNVSIGVNEPSHEKLYVDGNIRADGSYKVGGTVVIDSSRNLTNIGTISSGAITASGSVNLTAGQVKLRNDVALDHDGSSLYVKAPSRIYFYPGNNNKGNIDTSGNLTLSGKVTASDTSYFAKIESPEYRNATNVSNATTPANTAGWFKIAKVTRGAGKILLSFTGGNYSPDTYVIEYFKNWSTVASLSLKQFSNSSYITKAKIRQDSSDNNYYVEIYCSSNSNGLNFQVYHQRLSGFFQDGNIVYGGSLTAGSTSGTDYVTEKLFEGYGGLTLQEFRSDIYQGNININNGELKIGNTAVITNSRNLVNIGNITSSGSNGLTVADHIKATGNNLKFHAGGTHVLNIDLNRKIYPQTDASTDLGFSSSVSRFRHAYFSGQVNSGSVVATGSLKLDPDVGNNVEIAADGSYGTSGTGRYVTIGFGGTSNGSNRIFAHNTGGDGIYIAAATGRNISFRTNGAGSETFRMTSDGKFQAGSSNTTIIDASRNIINANTVSIGQASNSLSAKLEALGTDARLQVHYYGQSRGGIGAFTNQRVGMYTTSTNDDLIFGTTTTGASANFVTRMYIDNGTGNIGIGTANPTNHLNTTTSHLPVDNNARFLTINGGANGSFLMLESSTTTDADQIGGVVFTRTSGQGDAHKNIASIDCEYDSASLGGGILRFFTKPNGSATSVPRMKIDQSGNLYMGSTIVLNQSRNLTNIASANVAGNITVDYTGNGTNDAGLFVQNDASDWGIRIHKISTHTYGMQIDADGSYVFRTVNSSGQEKFRIDGDGDIETVRNINSSGTLTTADVEINSNGIYLNNGNYRVGTTAIVDSSRNLVNIGTISNNNTITNSIGTTLLGLDITGSSSNYTSAAIKNTSTGDAILWFDASNGDLAGSDYASIRQTNGLSLVLKTESSGGSIILQPAGTTALTLSTSQNATFAGTIQNGSVWINDGTNYNNYNENIRLFNPANNVSVIAFGATGTGGTPTSSILGYSDRFETRLGNTWRSRLYSSGLYVNGGYYVGTTAVIDSSRNLTNIGTISSGAIDSQRDSGDIPTEANANLYLLDTRSLAANTGGSIVFSSYYQGTTAVSGGPYIKGYKENATSGDYGYGLKFGVRENGQGTTGPVFTLNSTGNAIFTGTISSHTITTSGDININTANDGLYFSGGNNRIYFNNHRAMEGATDGSNLQIAEGYTTILAQANLNISSGHSYQVNGTTVIDSSRNIITGSNLYFGATDSSLLAKDGANIKYMADGIHTFWTYDGAWVQRAQITDSGLSVTGTISSSGSHIQTSTTPHHYTANSQTGTYNKTVTYINQNNTSGSTSNGMFIEMGRITNSSSAEVRHFVVGARGGQINFKVNGSGTGTFTGDVVAYSDERLKNNIQTLDGKKALQMRGVSFERDGKQNSGVIAQEIEKIAPELVHTNDDEMKTKSVAYGNLVGYLIEAIKEQQKEIEYMKSEINNLKEVNNGD